MDVEVLVQAGVDRRIAWPDENIAAGIAKVYCGGFRNS
jgi:hypothetical protein